jgi:hypothetical protein
MKAPIVLMSSTQITLREITPCRALVGATTTGCSFLASGICYLAAAFVASFERLLKADLPLFAAYQRQIQTNETAEHLVRRRIFSDCVGEAIRSLGGTIHPRATQCKAGYLLER